MDKQKTGKALLSISVVLSAIVSTIVDLLPGETGHVFNTGWTPHARFHDIVMFLLLDQLSVVSLWLLWRRSSEPIIGVRFAILLILAFWTPFYYVTTIFPMSSLSSNAQDVTKVSVVVAGVRVYINVAIGSAMIIIALIGYWLYGRGGMRVRGAA